MVLDGPLGAPARLRELVEGRVGELEPAARDVLERLALCQPVGLGRLEAAAGLTVLEALERDGLITVRTDGRRESVRLAHPLHGEVLRAGMSALRRRSILLAEAEALEGLGRGAERTRCASPPGGWRRPVAPIPDCCCGPPAWLATTTTSGGPQTLARAALIAEPSAAAGLVLGESLYNLGSFEEAETVLADATERAEGDDEVVRVATVRRRNLWRGCRRDADAVAVGRAAAARVRTSEARDELLTGEAEILAMSGRPARRARAARPSRTSSRLGWACSPRSLAPRPWR